jgi:hypothetical protein
MTKKIWIFLLLFSTPLFGNKINETPSDKVFIMLFNPDDCTACLHNIYSILNFLEDQNIPKEKLILVMKNKRSKILQTNDEKTLKSEVNCDKLSLVWNSDLYDKLADANNVKDQISVLLIYERTTNKFIFHYFAKLLNPMQLHPYLTSSKN